MKPDPSRPPRLRQQQVEQAAEQHAASSQSGQQFDSVEELIRFDASQTPPPPGLEERVKTSIAQEPPPRTSWWRRLFRKPG